MIKHLLTTGFLTLSLFAAAQTVTNPGFENWSDSGLGYDDPDDWTTSNILSLFGAPVNVTESSDAHGGSSAASLETADFMGEMLPGILAQQIETTATPDSLIFWAKYTPTGSDEFTASITLTNNTVPVGAGTYSGVASANGYVRIAVGVEYVSTDAPDTLSISFLSSGDNGEIGSVLLVDDVSLVTNPTTGVGEIKQQAPMSLYPNPARESLNIEVAKDATIEIYNALGMLVETIKADSDKPFVLSTSDYRSGVYLAKSSTGVTQRFVVKH